MPNPKLLLLADWFAPGFRAGGPITSCVNLCKGLSRDFSIFVLTGDRDLGDSSPYPYITSSSWQNFAPGIQVYYCPPEEQNYRSLRQLIRAIQPDVIYINSMFSKVFAVYPLLMLYRRQLPTKVVLAPRGMLRDSALRFKSLKKRLFLMLFERLNIWKRVTFHAVDAEETQSILTALKKKPEDIRIVEIPNFPASPAEEGGLNRMPVSQGAFLFLGRIHPIKGLLSALNALKSVKARITFNIAGPLENKDYWEHCRRQIALLPSNVKVEYLGEQPPSKIRELLTQHAFLLLPTQGENFGHAIFEAFATGRPVIISDQTPWRGLREKGIGWDVDITRPESMREALRGALELNEEQYQQMCRAAHQFAVDFIEKSRLKERYLSLFSMENTTASIMQNS